MKKTLILSLLFVFQSCISLSSDKWEYMFKNTNGNSVYVRNVQFYDGNLYYENKMELLEPNERGTMCYWDYRKVKCKTLSWKYLKFQSYGRPKCQGKGKYKDETVKDSKWNFNEPGQLDYVIHKELCNRFR